MKRINKTRTRSLQMLLLSVLTTSIILTASINFHSCSILKKRTAEQYKDTLYTSAEAKGYPLAIEFVRGESHNHPTFAIWTEDTTGNYLETLFITQSIGKGIFRYGKTHKGEWQPGERRRSAALPYWAHKRNIKAEDGLYIPSPENPMPDAVTGATPPMSFRLVTATSDSSHPVFQLMFEVNQAWDYNEYWTNTKYSNNQQYKASCQPAVVYSARINMQDTINTYRLKPIGHSHHAGKNGELFPDLSTLTTALDIAEEIRVAIPDSAALVEEAYFQK